MKTQTSMSQMNRQVEMDSSDTVRFEAPQIAVTRQSLPAEIARLTTDTHNEVRHTIGKSIVDWSDLDEPLDNRELAEIRRRNEKSAALNITQDMKKIDSYVAEEINKAKQPPAERDDNVSGKNMKGQSWLSKIVSKIFGRKAA